MAKCIKCSSFLNVDVTVCPICGAGQPTHNDPKIDNIDNKLSSSPSFLSQGTEEDDPKERELEIKRLIQRGDDCFKSGKAWLGAKDRNRARKEFQRAFNYYDTVLKMEPNNERIREARSKCLFKMA